MGFNIAKTLSDFFKRVTGESHFFFSEKSKQRYNEIAEKAAQDSRILVVGANTNLHYPRGCHIAPVQGIMRPKNSLIQEWVDDELIVVGRPELRYTTDYMGYGGYWVYSRSYETMLRILSNLDVSEIIEAYLEKIDEQVKSEDFEVQAVSWYVKENMSEMLTIPSKHQIHWARDLWKYMRDRESALESYKEYVLRYYPHHVTGMVKSYFETPGIYLPKEEDLIKTGKWDTHFDVSDYCLPFNYSPFD
ncbi:MAG: hypothetical protein LRY50_00880 [Geovibrio sp.]|nr:hypothetical protein [Geovibrio sp.]